MATESTSWMATMLWHGREVFSFKNMLCDSQCLPFIRKRIKAPRNQVLAPNWKWNCSFLVHQKLALFSELFFLVFLCFYEGSCNPHPPEEIWTKLQQISAHLTDRRWTRNNNRRVWPCGRLGMITSSRTHHSILSTSRLAFVRMLQPDFLTG